MSRVVYFLIEAAISAVVSVYFHLKMFYKKAAKILPFILKTEIKLDINTFIGVILIIIYAMVFGGKIESFHGFYDALPALAESSGLHGGGAIIIMALISIGLLLFGRGILVLLGYITVFYLYIILSAFETPQKVGIGVSSVGYVYNIKHLSLSYL